jgi:hypothetical protein
MSIQAGRTVVRFPVTRQRMQQQQSSHLPIMRTRRRRRRRHLYIAVFIVQSIVTTRNDNDIASSAQPEQHLEPGPGSKPLTKKNKPEPAARTANTRLLAYEPGRKNKIKCWLAGLPLSRWTSASPASCCSNDCQWAPSARNDQSIVG